MIQYQYVNIIHPIVHYFLNKMCMVLNFNGYILILEKLNKCFKVLHIQLVRFFTAMQTNSKNTTQISRHSNSSRATHSSLSLTLKTQNVNYLFKILIGGERDGLHLCTVHTFIFEFEDDIFQFTTENFILNISYLIFTFMS